MLDTLTGLFGGLFTTLNISLLGFSFFIISSFIRNKQLRIISSILFSLIVILQTSSLYFTKTYISYSFIIHFNTRDFDLMIGLYKSQFTLLLLLWTILATVLYYSSFISDKIHQGLQKLAPHLFRTKAFSTFSLLKTICFIAMIGVMCTERGIITFTSNLISTLNIDTSKSFTANLEELGIHDYVFPDDLQVSSKKKNIIILSLESYEKGYLSDHFSHLTPNLRALKANDDWNYYNMNQNEGSKWTSGSLYTTLTGFPAFFGTQHNSIFQTTYSSSVTSIAHILDKAGYKMTYIVDDAKCSGTEDMLYALNFKNILDRSTLSKIRDKDLFETAKLEVLANEKEDAPFLLYLSTLSTHNPHGVYDDRMEKFLPTQERPIEFMASAVDYMINDFIQFLKDNNVLSNTVIYIMPDHLKHGDAKMFDATGERGMYVLTNAPSHTISYDKKDTLLQIDLPRVILEGAEVKHNCKFLTDYITSDKANYIKDNITELTKINISGFSRNELHATIVPIISEHYDTYKNDTTRFIAHAGGIIDGNRYTNSLEALNENYEKGFRLFELDIRKTSDGQYVAVHEWNQWSEFTENKLNTPVSHHEFMHSKILSKYSPMDMDMINNWFGEHSDAIMVSDKINDPLAFAPLFIDKERLMMKLFSWEAVEEGLKANIKSVIASENLINQLEGDKLEALKKLNIKHVALSRMSIANNLDLLKALKDNDIKVYAYHVNSNIDKDEEYVVKYEMDYIYGIYADKWNFE